MVLISWLWHYIHYVSIPLLTKRWSEPFRGTHCKSNFEFFKNTMQTRKSRERILRPTKQWFHQEYYCFLDEPFLFRPIGREKQNLAPFLLVEIKLFFKKTIIIFLVKLSFRCFLAFKIRFQCVSQVTNQTLKRSHHLLLQSVS